MRIIVVRAERQDLVVRPVLEIEHLGDDFFLILTAPGRRFFELFRRHLGDDFLSYSDGTWHDFLVIPTAPGQRF